ncbi:MAG: hypothetical protein KKB20_03670 [Proteobacteria bacterium]|nr:hypothetical protein [Pseudomonadota bacterium]
MIKVNWKKMLVCVLTVAFMVTMTAATVMAAEKASTVTGVLEKTDAGYVLKAGKKVYMLEGGELDKLVGKKVMLKGAMKKGEKGAMILSVTSAKEAPAKVAKKMVKKAK